MNNGKKLFLLDVDSIQNYIFDTNRLKTIIGASWLVDHINAEDDGETFKLLKNGFKFGSNAGDVRKNDKFIYSSGGNTVLIFDSKNEAEKFEKQITKKYQELGISVTIHIQEMGRDESPGTETFLSAQRTLSQKKYNKSNHVSIAGSPYFKICELCGKRYGEKLLQDKEVAKVVCPVCHHKYNNAKPKMRSFPETYKFYTDMDELKPTEGMVAVVVMDGNNMGQKIRKLKDKTGVGFFSQLKDFSIQTEKIVHESFRKIIKEPPYYDSGKINFIRPIIMGGDDLCFIIDGAYALDFIERFTASVEKASEKDLFDGGITLCAGAVFMKKTYPFNFAHRIAESLLCSAKAASRKVNNCSMVDFHLILSSACDDIKTVRRREYTYNDGDGQRLELTAKPYKTSELKNIISHVKGLNYCLARNKIKYLRQALRKGRHESTLEILKILSRLDNDKRGKFLNIVNDNKWQIGPDHPWNTGLLDIIELTDLIGG